MFFKTTLLVALAALSQAMPTTPAADTSAVAACKPDDVHCITDSMLFSSSMTQFLTLRSQNYHSPPLTYKSDGCSVPKLFVDEFQLIDKDRPYGRYNFINACYRHDFGCNNYKKQKRFTKTNKKPIDEKFKTDLLAICDAQFADPRTPQPAGATLDDCKHIANIYYLGAAVYFGGIQGE
ncbi:hypothetical protein TWF696_003753 [Orbilia brochopaga]|uniref:Uncharacterized protein n=1 Tax=Orbilia brochopaga TaxID=3140254 RepID=A0AAV9V410_9PEZI